MRLFATALLVLAACGDDGSAVPADARAGDVDDASGQPDGAPPPTCAVPASFDEGITPTAVVHVDDGGSDETGDGTEGAPYATIERAVQDAAPGTAVRLHSGTYAADQYVSELRGTAAAPIWIGGAPGEADPVLSGGAEGLHLSRVSYVVVHDLAITGATSNGLNADDGGAYDDPTASHHVVFRNLYIHDIGGGGNQDCLKLSGLYDYRVTGSEFHTCGGASSGSGVDHVGCHRGMIDGNYFHDLSGNAVQNKGDSTDIVIRGNRMIDCGERAVNMGGSTGFEFFRPPLSTTESNAEARRIHVYANIIEGSNAPAAFVGCTDCLFAHNTVIDPDNWVARILQETTGDATYAFDQAARGRFINNLVYFVRGDLSTFVNVGANTMPDTFTFAGNLWYAHDVPGSSTPSLPVPETGGVIGLDPMLDANYRTPATSPAVGAGEPLADVAGDFAGKCYGTSPTIGAFEP